MYNYINVIASVTIYFNEINICILFASNFYFLVICIVTVVDPGVHDDEIVIKNIC